MTLKHNDLMGTILPTISIDEFVPKAGTEDDVIVVSFYFTDRAPANDLNDFIQRGVVDVLDVEVSPNTDTSGRFLVFVEMYRNEMFPNKLKALVKDIQNLTGPVDWAIKPYRSGSTFSITDPLLFNYIDLNNKDTKPGTVTDDTVTEFLQHSHIGKLVLEGNAVSMIHGRSKVYAEIVDIGKCDEVLSRNSLTNVGFNLTETPYEATVLANILGVFTVLPIGKFLLVSDDDNDRVMLLKNSELRYT